jgi:hypothetical protein
VTVQTAPCEWPVSYAGCTDGLRPEPLASMAPSGIALYEAMASEYLWRWTGKSLGLCELTIQPCRADCTAGQSTFGSSPSAAPWRPVLVGGRWYNIGCGDACGDGCGCGGGSPLRLPGPVDDVQEVREDDVALDPSAYYVRNNSTLVRTDGLRWSPCSLEITYTRGVPVPVGGQIAAGVLANELALAACGDDECRLPSRVQTVTRQGVTIAMLDAFDDIDKGHTGIWIIDSWLASMTKAPQRPVVLSPDVPRTRVRRRT